MIFKKAGLLSIILISTPTLAADTASYAVNLSHLHEAQLSLNLTDASGNPIPGVQNISLIPDSNSSVLEANRILEGSKLKSNARLQEYKITRTLSPIHFNNQWMDYTHPQTTFISSHISMNTNDCDERAGELQLDWPHNTDATFTSTMPAGSTSICSTNIAYKLKTLHAGRYNGYLNLHITPKL
ncbi:TPA: hypothetical protein L3M97_001792 [Vibrio parahaemolyticus]|nr:hypothetical protein [Vibrio parahaemolyticus]